MLTRYKSILNISAHSPGKTILTLISVALGVGILILTLSLSSYFQETLQSQLTSEGSIITIRNGSRNEEGEIELAEPLQVDKTITRVIREGMPGEALVSPVSPLVPFQGFAYAESQWLFRSVLGVNEEYGRIMSLDIMAGRFLTEEDLDKDNPVVVISRGAAEMIFGSAETAVGKILLSRPLSFQVIGVYDDPPEVKREAFSVPDAVIPVTTAVAGIVSTKRGTRTEIERYLYATLQLNVRDMSPKEAESHLRALLAAEYGDAFEITAWEGSLDEENDFLTEVRSRIDNFTLIISLLGFVLLAAASIGILSIMMVEALGKVRQIGLERAFGASKKRIVLEFFRRSLFLSLLSAVLGTGIAFVFASPLQRLLLPMYSSIGMNPGKGSVISGVSIIVGVVTALAAGGVLGTVPVFSLLKSGIAESINEE
jgi:putative ABC transport system permease protein